MIFTPADFCIGESDIWFFSLMWEHGKDVEPVEFLDDKNILEKTDWTNLCSHKLPTIFEVAANHVSRRPG